MVHLVGHRIRLSILRAYISVGLAQGLAGYARLNRPYKGVVLRYLLATCGYSRAQLTRLLTRVLNGHSLRKRYRSPAHAFAQRYTPNDALLLAEAKILIAEQIDSALGCEKMRRRLHSQPLPSKQQKPSLRLPAMRYGLAPVLCPLPVSAAVKCFSEIADFALFGGAPAEVRCRRQRPG